jgi:HEAT repeat protein
MDIHGQRAMHVRWEIAQAVGSIGPAAIPALVKVLKDR